MSTPIIDDTQYAPCDCCGELTHREFLIHEMNGDEICEDCHDDGETFIAGQRDY